MIALIHRSPTVNEFERFRLILSTYQDGTGMLAVNNTQTIPGWRDFERSVAHAFGGKSMESKFIYDVLIPDPDRQKIFFGISCKMRKTLKEVDKKGIVTIEVSNSAGEFWNYIKAESGLNEESYRTDPTTTGRLLIELVEGWYYGASLENGGNVDKSNSHYLVLQWDERTQFYQLFQYPSCLPNPSDIEWSVVGRRLLGIKNNRTIIEWYGHSGGQLKYYPLAEDASWRSERFQLEPLPNDIKTGLIAKAQTYFPIQWERASIDKNQS